MMTALETNLESLVDALVPLGDLSPQSQSQILSQAEILRFDPGEYVFHQGDTDPYSFYLLEGSVELIADGQTLQRLAGGTPDAVRALAQLQPRKMSARAETEAAILKVSRDLVDKLAAADLSDSYCDVEVREIEAEDEDGDDWMSRMLQSQLFSQLPASNIQRIFSLLETLEVKQDDIVVEQGGPGDFYYVIAQGRCEVTRAAGPNAPGFRLALIGPGDAFGEEALVAGSTRNASVRMLTDGQLVRLPKEAFIELIQTPLLSSVSLEEGRNIAATRDAIWLDVRFPEEFEASGLDDAVNHPLNTLRMHSGRLDANRTYIVYCDTGTRSAVAAFLLAERGFSVHCLEGGLMAFGLVEGKAEPAREPAPAAKTAEAPEQAEAAEASDAEVDLELHDDEQQPAASGPAEAPIPSSHLTDSERPEDPAVKAAALSVELELNEMRIAEVSARAKTDPEELPRLEAERKAEAQRAADEAAQRARAEAEAEAAKQIEAERKRVAEEMERVRLEAERKAENKLLEEKKRLEAEATKARQQLVEAQRKKAAEERGKVKNALAEEKKRLEEAASAARRELAEAQRLKAEMVREKAEAEDAVRKEREAQDEKVERVRAEMERKLAEEERKLKASYAWQAEELKRLKTQKADAEHRLQEEQARLQEQAEESAARLAEARDYQKRLEEAQQASAAEAERREQQQLELERKLREELKDKVQTERAALEEELARNAAELERARQERESAEAARHAAAQEAEQIISEFKEAHDRKRVQEEADMRVERERLQAESERLRLALELAEREKKTAVDTQARIEQEIEELRSAQAEQQSDDEAESIATDLRELEEQAIEAAQHVAEIERTHADAEAAAVASVGDLAAHKVHEEQARHDMERELTEWLQEQDELENSDIQQSILANQRAHIERIKKRAQQARKAAKAHDQALINELAEKLKQRDAEI